MARTVQLFIFSVLTLVALSLHEPHVKIFGGDLAETGQFPFVVAVNVYLEGYYNGHWCGASIIHPQWVLTAASCVQDYPVDAYYIQADTISLETGGTNYTVSTIIAHENFSYDTLFDDLALIKIEEEFKLSETAQIIEIDDGVANEICNVIGWGDTSNFPAPQIQLRFVELQILSPEDCDELAKGGIFNQDRGPGQICGFGGNGTGPCYGDSGDPLFCHDKLVGIVSYAIQPCALGYPDVYTRPIYYKEWIDNIISEH